MTSTTGKIDVTSWSSEQLIANAASLKGQILQQASEAESTGRYTPEVHEALLAGGLYHLMTPKRYGGIEADAATFSKIVMELAEGDPGSAWCYSLGHAHNLNVAAFWPEEVQDEVFRTDAGYFRASHSMQPAGTARRVEGGYVVNARSGYQSGVPYATHAIVFVELEDAGESRPVYVDVLVPAGQFTVLDDWGGSRTLGLRSSGSNSVVVNDQFVPEGYVHRSTNLPDPVDTVGIRLHGNPLYLGTPLTFQCLTTTSVMVGAARGAMEEYERAARSKPSGHPPFGPRSEDDIYQRDFFVAKMKTDTAEAAMLTAARKYTERSEAAVDGTAEFTLKMNTELCGMVIEAGRLACEAVEQVFSSIGASSARGGQRIERIIRDVQMFRAHNYNNYLAMARNFGAIYFDASERYNPN